MHARGARFSPETDALFADTDITSVEFLLKPNASARALCKEHAQPGEPVRVRAVRVVLPPKKTKSKVAEPSCVEVLVTNLLDSTAYSDDTFGALYNQRWTIEGDFRHLKSRLQLENWTGKSAEAVRQDVFARVLSKNVVQVVIVEAQRRLDLKLATQVRQLTPRKLNFWRLRPNEINVFQWQYRKAL